MWWSRRVAGMTLTEVMVYVVLLSLFSVLLFTSLPTRNSAMSEDLRAAAARADTVLERIALELGNSSASSVLASQSPPGVVFLSASSDGFAPITYTTEGEIAWLGWLAYLQEGDRLVRIWAPFASAVGRARVGQPPTLDALRKQGTATVVTSNVERFTVRTEEANVWLFDLRVSVAGNATTLVSGTGARNP